MAQSKSKSASGLGRDSRPKYLGVKISDGQKVKTGMIIVRQRGMKFFAGKNVGRGRDDTLYALKEGMVKFQTKRRKRFDGSKQEVKIVNVV